jgi:hypothetical protein
MISIDKNPTNSDIRRFAILWTLSASVLGCLLFRHQYHKAAQLLWVAGFFLVVVASLSPLHARWFFRGWIRFTTGINYLVTRLLLTLVFYGVITPMALLFRLFLRDTLMLKRLGPQNKSYWKSLEKITDVSDYKHLY